MNQKKPIVGWREWVSLPDLGIDWMKAKVDTGARSSSLHAHDVEHFERDGAPWLRFVVLPWQGSDLDATVVEAPLHESREVRSSTGETQIRPVVRTTVRVAGVEHPVDVTLTDRSGMRFRMLLGREAVRRRFLVDPGRSYRGGKAPRVTRARNRQTSS